MKKSKTLLTFTALATAAMVTGCSYSPGQNIEGDVYGPPAPPVGERERSEEDVTAENVAEETETRTNELVYGPPSFVSRAGANPDVYGPPEDR